MMATVCTGCRFAQLVLTHAAKPLLAQLLCLALATAKREGGWSAAAAASLFGTALSVSYTLALRVPPTVRYLRTAPSKELKYLADDAAPSPQVSPTAGFAVLPALRSSCRTGARPVLPVCRLLDRCASVDARE